MHYGNRFDGKGKRERERETGMFWEHVKYCKRGKKAAEGKRGSKSAHSSKNRSYEK